VKAAFENVKERETWSLKGRRKKGGQREACRT
jgi:hypothetical protein